jgi:apolipoprotein N-acyltransferase
MLRQIRSVFFTYLACPILLAAAFLHNGLTISAWFGLVPLFFCLESQDPKGAFRRSYICGLFFFAASMYWLLHVTALGWLALSFYQALYFGIFGLAYKALVRPGDFRFTNYIYVPSLWVVLEYMRSHAGGGIGWNLLAYSQYRNIPLIQMADITGVYGVSFIIVLVNFCIYLGIKMAVRCQKTHGRLFARSNLSFVKEIRINPLLQTLFVCAVTGLVVFYGYDRMDTLAADRTGVLKATVVQGNIPQLQKWDPSFREHIKRRYRDLTLQAVQEESDIIIWPETSVPGYINRDRRLSTYVRDIARDVGRPLLVGGPLIATTGSGDDPCLRGEQDYNCALLFSGTGRLLAQYNKLHLVAFGEFVPFEKYLPFLRNHLPLTGEFIPGDDFTLFDIPDDSSRTTARLGALICFEDIFPDLVRGFVRKGADVMVNMTNDAWFGRSAAAYQHAANSVFRAVENRRPFIRSANTGLSCFIARTGFVYSRVDSAGQDLFVAGYRTDTVRFDKDGGISAYTRFGDLFTLFCGLITGVFLFDYTRRQRYNK